MNSPEILLGIVVSVSPVRDADVNVRLLTPEGLRTVTAIGARKANAKLKGAVQLFTIAEFSVIGHKITGAHVLHANHSITKDIKRYYLACAICEVISQCQGAGFELTTQALAKLGGVKTPDTDVSPPSVKGVFTEYFTNLLIELGFGVEPDVDLNTAYARYLDIQIPNTRLFL